MRSRLASQCALVAPQPVCTSAPQACAIHPRCLPHGPSAPLLPPFPLLRADFGEVRLETINDMTVDMTVDHMVRADLGLYCFDEQGGRRGACAPPAALRTLESCCCCGG